MGELTHFDAEGASRMVDIGDKPVSQRSATASSRVRMSRSTLELIRQRGASKGDVLEVARLAGIMAAKRTDALVPLCHQLPLDSVAIDFELADDRADVATGYVNIRATARVTARTGVEMEALVAVSVAALTVYDMCKGVDRGMVIEQVQLEEKHGGRSGHYVRGAAEPAAP
jgi:cyclic pyranopterin phosphate synthase